MFKKMNKIMLKIVIIEFVVLCGFVLKAYFTPAKVMAAHDAGTPSELYVTITSIDLVNTTGSQRIFSGNFEVDLAKVSALGTAAVFDVTIPVGDYTGARVVFSKIVKAKGSVTMSGTTYYTKEVHSSYTSGPAELETIDMGLDQYNEVNFLRTMTLSGTVTVRLVVDIENVLCYWDGSGTQPKPEMSAGTMNIVPLPLAVCFGSPGIKEVYEVTDDASSTAKGRLALIYDSNGNFVGGMGRAIVKNSNTSSIFFTGGFSINIYTENTNGTINMGAESKNEGQTIAWYMPHFRRSALNGTTTGDWNIVYNRATGATSGTYSSIRTE